MHGYILRYLPIVYFLVGNVCRFQKYGIRLMQVLMTFDFLYNIYGV